MGVELNVVSIVVGVIISRVIYIWMGNTGLFIQSTICIDPDSSIDDLRDAKDTLPGTITSTALSLLIVIFIIAGYTN